MKILFATLLFAATAFGQNTNKVQTGVVDAHAGTWIPPEALFSAPPASPPTGAVFTFKDASASGTCTGGGSALALCRWNGTGYDALGGGGGGGMVYPGAGIPSSTGSAWGTSKTAPTGVLVGDSDTQSLTGKTVDGATPTEIGYLSGVTSPIQTQLNAKAASTASTTVNGQTCALGSTCTVADSTKVPTTTTVNGHALSGNINVTATDLSLNNVTNDAQTKASVVPNTAPAAGQLLAGNAGGTAYAPVTMSGNCTLASTGAISCTLPFKSYFSAAGCNQTAAGPSLEIPSASGPAANCYGTAPRVYAGLDFVDGSDLTASINHRLPDDWTGNIDLRLDWLCSSSSGCSTNQVDWTVRTVCVGSGDYDNPTFNSIADNLFAGSATRYARLTSLISAITVTGCSAGNAMVIRIGRTASNGSDTLAATATLLGVEVTLRRAM